MTSRGGKGDRRVVVVKKKAKGHGGHHGGSWKVAYADFVTAMMAFFLVMWIMSMDEGVKDMVQGYFQNPVGFKKTFSGGTNPLAAGNAITNLDVKRTLILNRRIQEHGFREAARKLRERLDGDPVLQGLAAEVEVVITEEGLRIELMETDGEGAFFDRASARLKPELEHVLTIVGSILQAIPGDVVLEGHTDALPFGREGYGNWELSVDRANAARRELQAGGLDEARVTQVRGYADRRLKVPERPLDAHNRRISVLLPYFEVSEDALRIPGVDPDLLNRSAESGRSGL